MLGRLSCRPPGAGSLGPHPALGGICSGHVIQAPRLRPGSGSSESRLLVSDLKGSAQGNVWWERVVPEQLLSSVLRTCHLTSAHGPP